MIKIFCGHDWKTHIKKEYDWTQKSIVEGTQHWFNPVLQELEYSVTYEILICKKCGKTKKIKY